MPTDDEPAGGSGPPIEVLADLVASHRPDSRRLRRVVASLTEGPQSLAALVRGCGLSRRTVEEVLEAAGADLVWDGETARIRPERSADYRQRFGYGELARTQLADPVAERLAAAAPLVRSMAGLVARAPEPRAELDHVTATPVTVVRRALWLDSTYDLAGTAVLCLGDHDLTSLAIGQVNRDADVVVVDLDDRTLEFVDTCAAHLGVRIRCLFADLRFGLPEPAAGWADLVFTDPPYTPEGVELFVTRALQALGNRGNGRVIVAYGYGDRQPTLGAQAQSAAHRLGLAYEAVLPGFNRYLGAQAVGSASDLYVWRPTPRTWRVLDRAGGAPGPGIYTRGPQAIEKPAPERGPVPAAALRLAEDQGYPLRALVGDRWQDTGQNAARMRLGTLLAAGLPQGVGRRGPFAVLADLSADPGAWLLRTLLAANAGRLVAQVAAGHPDVSSEAAQASLGCLVQAKYRLRFLRGQPDGRHTLVVADAVDPQPLPRAARLANWLLHRAHGKVGNVWRDGLVRLGHDAAGGPVTKRDARAAVQAACRREEILQVPLVSLPRHQIAQLLEDCAASAHAHAG